MASYTDTDELSVPKATSHERKWINEFDRLLKKMPKRLYLLECADTLMVVDRAAARHTEMNDGGASDAGIVLAVFDNGVFACTSVSG